MQEIKVLGAGCKRCDELEKRINRLVDQKGAEVRVSKVSDFQKMAELGVFSTPGVVVNGEVKAVGRVPRDEEILEWIS
ncbi:MAG: thioredoxin family protein [Desulfobulbaceae bacterium]|nr:MAG: thioredoxin family protein [Desulfobulbaceae bacterium]